MNFDKGSKEEVRHDAQPELQPLRIPAPVTAFSSASSVLTSPTAGEGVLHPAHQGQVRLQVCGAQGHPRPGHLQGPGRRQGGGHQGGAQGQGAGAE